MQQKTAPSLATLAPQNKRILLRVDYNFAGHENASSAIHHRLQASLPTLRHLISAGARVGILTHRGRPQGQIMPELSLIELAPVLSKLLGQPVSFIPDCIGRVAEHAMDKLAPGQVLLFENTRFHIGEQLNQLPFAQALARLGDALVNDAFACAHRAQASTSLLATLLPSVLGVQFEAELHALARWQQSAKPKTMLLGGNDVARKLELMRHLLTQVEVMVAGGVIGQTLLAAKDVNLPHTSVNHAAIEPARNLLAEAGVLGCRLHLPRDFLVAHFNAPETSLGSRRPHALEPAETAQDIGPQTLLSWQKILAPAPSVIWLGALGRFEHEAFAAATYQVAQWLAERHRALPASPAPLTIIGGNGLLQALGAERLAAFTKAGVFVSTGGGALHQALAGHPLPALQAITGA